MKKALFLLAIVAAVSLFPACSCSSAPGRVTADFSSSGKQVTVAVNGTVTVTLDSNVTTGFAWSVKSISDSSVLSNTGHEYKAPPQPVPGAGGSEVWTFQAAKAGKAVLSMEYSQPWPGGTKAAKTFSLTVNVK